MAIKPSIIAANAKRDALIEARCEKRRAIKGQLIGLSSGTVIDRYIIKDGKLMHLRKDKYKKLLEAKTIKIAENKPKKVVEPEKIIESAGSLSA